jgi:hypothetical protein
MLDMKFTQEQAATLLKTTRQLISRKLANKELKSLSIQDVFAYQEEHVLKQERLRMRKVMLAAIDDNVTESENVTSKPLERSKSLTQQMKTGNTTPVKRTVPSMFKDLYGQD